ncbi:MAG TPA: radical SAM protein [Clostridiales bacterium]|nr:radical SAM protein [Clostridiales bacterium]
MSQSIYTHDTIYIPPREEGSAPLEVALGCSWGQCTFCDFARDAFRILPRNKILENIEGLSRLFPDKERVFFLGENAFVLRADVLLDLFAQVRKKMPSVETFAMYARADDVLSKSAAELESLRIAGLDALHIGVESGSDSILAERKKGLTAQQMLEAFRLLELAGIDYHLTVVLGLGGKAYSRLHAIETARLLNKTHPRSIWCLKLAIFDGTPLSRECKAGTFAPMEPLDVLAELRLLLQNLTVTDCIFEDTTVLDTYTLQGDLPGQKDLLLRAIDRLLSTHAVL